MRDAFSVPFILSWASPIDFNAYIWWQFFPSWIPFDWHFSRPAQLVFFLREPLDQLEISAITDFRGLPGRRSLSPRVFPSRASILSCAHYFQGPAQQANWITTDSFRALHAVDSLTIWLTIEKSKEILNQVDICRQYFLVCQLNIAFYFLHELKRRSSDMIGRHWRNRLTFKFCFTVKYLEWLALSHLFYKRYDMILGIKELLIQSAKPPKGFEKLSLLTPRENCSYWPGFNSPCPPECYFQSETKIEPDLRLENFSVFFNLGPKESQW